MGDRVSVLRVRARYRLFPVRGEGLFLLSEHDTQFFEGPVFADLADHLADGADPMAAVDALAPVHGRAVAHYALDVMRRRGVLAEEEGQRGATAVFWDELGYDPGTVERGLADAAVAVTALGGADPAPVAAAIEAFGIEVVSPSTSAGHTPQVVLTTNCLSPELADLARDNWHEGRSWLLAGTTGLSLWLGPLFTQDNARYTCLTARLGANRSIDRYVAKRAGNGLGVTSSLATTPVHAPLVAGLVALETAKWLADTTRAQPPDVRVIDLATLASASHPVQRRPQCETCGDPKMQTQLMTTPPRLDGAPEAPKTLADLRRFVSPVTGMVSIVEPADSGLARGPTYTAFFGFGGDALDLQGLKNSAISQGAGVGTTAEEAECGAICEAIERYSGMAVGDEPALHARYVDLDPATTVNPTACMLYSERQYAMRHTINRDQAAFNAVPEPFDDQAMLDWTGVWSLTTGRFKLLPSSFLFYFYPRTPDGPYCWADSNGCAAGTSLADAVSRGLYELVERDGVAIWWYNRLRRPAVDIGAVADPFVRCLLGDHRTIGREVWALDLTTDLGIPTFAAISRRLNCDSEDIVLGFGAHLDPRAALRHAVLELNHILPAVLPTNRTSDGDYPYPEAAQKAWWRTATIESEPYLLPSDAPLTAPPPAPSPLDVHAQLRRLRANLEETGHEVLVLDQTRPDVGLPVAKVIVPGLRHFWARLTPGRLYDVPVSMGWLAEHLREEQLNPTAMFL
ncbi:TOMM precursor leader peptide-binding protein [Streptomyces sp. QHH-9511]|uniref:TOMM precursor leader peptide-binding protein n=1 Tax=Streptomyces sp. QHH-9511 TaxID=2684468 RepID=UPI0013161D3D|nr:TOMM precursor leader peptide-binding protein [Streptomyces sp. QHH-9511]QGZ47066.1 TOMM precursor leader peptide-binding protein [Streptomyces sp. QHH-9511]